MDVNNKISGHIVCCHFINSAYNKIALYLTTF